MSSDLHTTESPAFLERWYTDQALGYWLDQAMSGGQRSLTSAEVDDLFHRFLLPMDLCSFGPMGSDRLRCLPASVLQQLSQVQHAALEGIRSQAEVTYHELMEPQNGTTSTFFQAKLIANRMRSGTHTPVQILRMMAKGIGNFPKLEQPDQKKIESLIGKFVRQASLSNYSFPIIIDTLAPISEALQHWKQWSLIENSILHSLFLWPMCVLEGVQGVGITLPLQLWVRPDNTSKKPSIRIVDGYKSAKLAGSLAENTRRSLDAAIAVWTNEFSNWSLEYHADVCNTQVTIDLGHARRIRSLAGYNSPLKLRGRSLEADLALGILGRLLGDTSAEGVSATGGIEIPENNKALALVEPVFGSKEKAEKLALSPDVEKLLFPGKVKNDLYEASVPSNVSLFFGWSLQDYAAEVFPDSFNKARFIRCPDLRLAYRDKLPRHQFLQSEVDDVRELIERSKDTILELGPKVSARSAARAIFEINGKCGEYAADARMQGYVARNEEFLQSSLFIRVADYETNDRFWQVVWEALTGSVRLDLPPQGGEANDWRSFAYSINWGQPARILAEKMNNAKANRWEPQRTPDKIVIVGAELLSESGEMCPRGPFKRLQLWSLKNSLRKALGQIKPEYVTDRVGQARLILLPHDNIRALPKIEIENITVHSQESVRALHVYQNGFSFDTAKAVMGVDFWQCHQLLKALCDETFDGVPLVSKAPKLPQYVLNFDLSDNEASDLDRARALYRGGLALVGMSAKLFDAYDEGTTTISSYGQMLKPAQVHDAEHLLGRARDLCRSHSGEPEYDDLYKVISTARAIFSRYGEPFSWSHIRHIASGRGGDGTDISLRETAVDHLERWPGPLHPIEAVHVAWLIWNEYKAIEKSKVHTDEEREVLLGQLSLALDRAERDAKAMGKTQNRKDEVNEEAASRFIIGSTFATLFFARTPGKTRTRRHFYAARKGELAAHPLGERMERYINWATDNVDEARDVPKLDWFIYLGDFVKNDTLALQHYSCALSNDLSGKRIHGLDKGRVFTPALVKYLGCTVRLGQPKPPAPILELARTVDAWAFFGVADTLRPTWGLMDRDVCDRWHKGRFKLLEILCTHHTWLAVNSAEQAGLIAAFKEGVELITDFKGLALDQANWPIVSTLLGYFGACETTGATPDPLIMDFVERKSATVVPMLEGLQLDAAPGSHMASLVEPFLAAGKSFLLNRFGVSTPEAQTI